MSTIVPQPVGFRAYIAWAADDARPEPLHIDTQNFGAAADARAWVEEYRAGVKDAGNFAACVIPIYGAAIS
jgi:hypothetical protein